MAGGRGGEARGAACAGGAGGAGGGGLIDSRPRDTLYLSSHRCPLAGPTKKEIGFADFDPFVFGQRPAMRAGAEKCEGALIGQPGAPRPRAAHPSAAKPSTQFKGGCRHARRFVWVSTIYSNLLNKSIIHLSIIAIK
ncbi:hypothetical protein O0L34_g3918 [Tuta absoluta]|nr:hypothetical protein O0L34_g3918 [Tuta absoluta]